MQQRPERPRRASRESRGRHGEDSHARRGVGSHVQRGGWSRGGSGRKLFAASLRMLVRDKQSLFFALGFPVIFAIVFGLFDFGRPPRVSLAVVSPSSAPQASASMSPALVDALEQVETFKIDVTDDLAKAQDDLAAGRLDMLLRIAPPDAAGAGRGAVEVVYNDGNPQATQFALGAIGHIVDQANLQLLGATSPPLELHTTVASGKARRYYDWLLPGLVALGVMNFSIIGVGVGVARFREQGILRRILATPLKPAKFVSAQVAARLLLSIAQALLILGVGVFAFHAHIYGNVLWLLALAALGNLVFLNIGLAVAGRSPNSDTAQALGQIVAVPMMFLSGVFFPTDTLPGPVRAVSQLLPLTPMLDAMRKVSLDGLPIGQAGSQLALLVAWVGASFLVARANFRFART